METKTATHTPGPWEWTDRYPDGDGEKAWSLIGYGGGEYGILSCSESNSPQGLHDEANARLIAAAPDLLEACKLLPLHMLDDEENGTLDAADFKDNSQKFLCAMAAASEAIVKATMGL